MSFMKLPKCPYCGKKLSYMKAWDIRKYDDYECDHCHTEYLIKYSQGAFLLAVGMIVLDVFIFLVMGGFNGKVSVISLVFMGISLVAIYFLLPLMMSLRRKKGHGPTKAARPAAHEPDNRPARTKIYQPKRERQDGRNQRPEARSQRPEARNQRPDVGRQKPEIRGRRPEDRSQRPAYTARPQGRPPQRSRTQTFRPRILESGAVVSIVGFAASAWNATKRGVFIAAAAVKQGALWMAETAVELWRSLLMRTRALGAKLGERRGAGQRITGDGRARTGQGTRSGGQTGRRNGTEGQRERRPSGGTSRPASGRPVRGGENEMRPTRRRVENPDEGVDVTGAPRERRLSGGINRPASGRPVRGGENEMRPTRRRVESPEKRIDAGDQYEAYSEYGPDRERAGRNPGRNTRSGAPRSRR